MSTTITILTTNDIHGRFLSSDGSDILDYVKLATYKKSLSNCLLMDAGDATQGTPLAILKRGLYPIELMNAIGYDAVTIGNHEFDNISKDTADTHELDEIIASSKAPYICANVIWKNDKENYIQRVYREKKIADRGNGRYLYKEVAGKKLLFVGVCTSEISKDIPRMADFEINKDDVVKEIKKAISDAKSECQCNRFDAVILLAHIGQSTSGYNTKNLINQLSPEDNISLIIDGHSHEKYNDDINVGIYPNKVRIFQADCYSKCFGIIKLCFEDSNKLTITARYGTNSDIVGCNPDEDVKKKLAEIKKEVDKEFGTEYSSGSNTTLWGGAIDEDKPYVRDVLEALNITRFVQTNLGKLTAEAMIHTVRTHHSDKVSETDYIVAGINGGAVRDSIPFGKPITGNELYYALPSLLNSEKESGYVLFKIKISKLKEVLGNSIEGLATDGTKITSGSGGFLNTAGIRYTIKYKNEKIVLDDKAILTCGKNSRVGIKEINFNSDGDKTVLLCVSKYIASGGDGYDFKGVDVKEVCKEKEPAIYKAAGEYIQYLSGSAPGKAKPLFYPAVASDIQYKDFSFAQPSQIDVTVKDSNGSLLTDRIIVYCFEDIEYKQYNVAVTNDKGVISITLPKGASTLCVGAALSGASKDKTYLYGELYLHSYFSLKKNSLECKVYSFDTSGYFTFDKNAWSQFQHEGINHNGIHYSNYITYFNENKKRRNLTILENKILTWSDEDKNIDPVTTVKYWDNKQELKQFDNRFPDGGISYIPGGGIDEYNSTLVNDNNTICLSRYYGGTGGEESTFHNGCLFAKNHHMDVVGLRVRWGHILDAIGFVYADNNDFFFGNPEGGGERIFRFAEGEYITEIEGFVEKTFYNCITKLTVYTNKNKYGPFGELNGTDSFTISMANHKICAILGEEAKPKNWNKKVIRKIGAMFMPI